MRSSPSESLLMNFSDEAAKSHIGYTGKCRSLRGPEHRAGCLPFSASLQSSEVRHVVTALVSGIYLTRGGILELHYGFSAEPRQVH